MNKLKKELLFKVFLFLIVILVGVYLFAVNYYAPAGANFLIVFEVNESTAQQGEIIHLTGQDFKEHPVLAEMIKEEESFERLFRRNGIIADRKEAEDIRNKFSVNTATDEQKYVEYSGRYYIVTVAVA